MTDIENYVKGPDTGERAGAGGAFSVSPGIRIVTYWQGIVEIALRAVILVLVFLTFLTSAIAVGEINDLDGDTQDFIDDSDEHHDDFSEVPNTPNLVPLSRAAGGFLIFLAFVVMFYEGILIVLRFINLGLVNQYIVIVFVVDAIICGVLAFIYLVTGSVAGRYSTLWDDWVEFGKDFQFVQFDDDEIDTGENIRGALGATCAFCIFLMLVLIGLAGWLLVSVFFKWYQPPQKNTDNMGS